MLWNQNAREALAAGEAHRYWLLWMQVKELTTLAPVDVGFWDGKEDRTFSVGGVMRPFVKVPGAIKIDSFHYGAGLNVRNQIVRIGSLDSEVQGVLRGYNTAYAPTEIHGALFSSGGVLLDIQRFWKGELDKITIERGADGQGMEVELEVSNALRRGTRSLALKKSDESQRLRQDDRFRRYGDLGTVSDDKWRA